MYMYMHTHVNATVKRPSVHSSCFFDVQDTFSSMIGGKRTRDVNSKQSSKKRLKTTVRDDDSYVPYRPTDFQSEKG